jgi:hypothetical protein
MAVSFRPAKETDQDTITSFIRQARINPGNLHWRHFLVYGKFGFKLSSPTFLPADLAREYWIGKIITSVASALTLNRINIIA